MKLKEKIKGSLFIKSWKRFDRRIAFIAAYDFLSYIALAVVIVLFLLAFKWNITGLQKTVPALTFIIGSYSETGKLPEITKELSNEVKTVKAAFRAAILKAITIFALFYTAAIAVLSLFKGLLWSEALEIKFSRLFFKRFLFLNLIWFSIWLLAFIFIFKFINLFIAAKIIIIGLFLMAYFTVLLCSLFDAKKALLKIIKEAFTVGIKKVHLFIFHYIIAAVVLLAVFYAVRLIDFIAPSAFILALFWILLFVYLAWIRIYISSVAKSVVK